MSKFLEVVIKAGDTHVDIPVDGIKGITQYVVPTDTDLISDSLENASVEIWELTSSVKSRISDDFPVHGSVYLHSLFFFFPSNSRNGGFSMAFSDRVRVKGAIRIRFAPLYLPATDSRLLIWLDR